MSAAGQQTHLGAYAVIRQGGQVLLVLKARGPYTGKWDLPGGRIEWGETPEAAVCREVCEETGLEVTTVQLLDVASCTVDWTTAGGEERLHHLGILFAAQGTSPILQETGDGEDAILARWRSVSKLESSELTPFARRAIFGAAS